MQSSHRRRDNKASLVVTAAAALAGLAASAGAAEAQEGAPGADADILGLRLSASRDDAKTFITAHYPGATITDLTAAMGAGSYSWRGTIGMLADIGSAADKAQNQQQNADVDAKARTNERLGLGTGVLARPMRQVGDYATDWLAVDFDPVAGSSDILAIARYTEYPDGAQPAGQGYIDALKAKYGPPFRTMGSMAGRMTMVWMAPGAFRQAPRGVKCFNDAFDVLYENAPLRPGFALDNRVQFTGQAFVNAVNLVHSRNPLRNVPPCGTVLQATLQFTHGGDFVGSANIRLMDLTRSYDALGRFADGFWQHVEDARQQKLKDAAGIRPRL